MPLSLLVLVQAGSMALCDPALSSCSVTPCLTVLLAPWIHAGSMVLSDPAALSYDKGAAATAAAMSNPAFTGEQCIYGISK
eukprot:406025-Pelagomonas_calceolata.AAC.7